MKAWVGEHWRALAFAGAGLLVVVGLILLDRALSQSGIQTLVAGGQAAQSSQPAPAVAVALSSEELEALRAAAAEARELLAQQQAEQQSEQQSQALRDEVLTTLEAWKQSWMAQDVGTYLSFYAADFATPWGISREEWASFRISRIQEPRWIRVEFEQLDFVQLEEDFAAISFTQLYATPGYADRSRKHMDLVRTELGWKIRSEDAVDTVRLE